MVVPRLDQNSRIQGVLQKRVSALDSYSFFRRYMDFSTKGGHATTNLTTVAYVTVSVYC